MSSPKEFYLSFTRINKYITDWGSGQPKNMVPRLRSSRAALGDPTTIGGAVSKFGFNRVSSQARRRHPGHGGRPGKRGLELNGPWLFRANCLLVAFCCNGVGDDARSVLFVPPSLPQLICHWQLEAGASGSLCPFVAPRTIPYHTVRSSAIPSPTPEILALNCA